MTFPFLRKLVWRVEQYTLTPYIPSFDSAQEARKWVKESEEYWWDQHCQGIGPPYPPPAWLIHPDGKKEQIYMPQLVGLPISEIPQAPTNPDGTPMHDGQAIFYIDGVGYADGYWAKHNGYTITKQQDRFYEQANHYTEDYQKSWRGKASPFRAGMRLAPSFRSPLAGMIVLLPTVRVRC